MEIAFNLPVNRITILPQKLLAHIKSKEKKTPKQINPNQKPQTQDGVLL